MKKELLTDRKTNSWGSVVKKDFIKHKATYALFIPVLLFYLIFHYAPLYGTIIAFKNFTPSGGIFGSPWVGMKHFLRFINLPTFGTIIGNTLKISIFSIIFAFPAPIILALLINELKSKRLAKIAQNATYLPHFISLVVVCGIVKDFTKDTGIITYILSFFGVPQVTLLMYPQYFLPIYIGSGIWQEAGWSSIVYLAALTSIDASLYEAASIDGAGKFKRLLHITLPGIAPTIITMLILRVGQVMSVGYEKILLLSNDSIIDVTDVISTYVYRVGLLDHSYSYSTAVNLFNSVINLALVLATNKISRKLSDTSLW